MRTFFRMLACSNRASNMAAFVSFECCSAAQALSVAMEMFLLNLGGKESDRLGLWSCVYVFAARGLVEYGVVRWIDVGLGFNEVLSGRERWSCHATRSGS